MLTHKTILVATLALASGFSFAARAAGGDTDLFGRPIVHEAQDALYGPFEPLPEFWAPMHAANPTGVRRESGVAIEREDAMEHSALDRAGFPQYDD